MSLESPAFFLQVEIHTGTVLPLWPLHDDLEREHLIELYAYVGCLHQFGGNPTSDLTKHLIVGLPPLDSKETGQNFQYGFHFHSQQATHRDKKGRKVGVAVGKPSGTSDFYHSPHSGGTSLETSGDMRQYLYSRHLCQECSLSLSYRGLGSEDLFSSLSIFLPLMDYWVGATHPVVPSLFAHRDVCV